MWLILVLISFVVMGVGIGAVLKNNNLIGYNVSSQFGKKHMKRMSGEEDEETHRWDD